MVGSVALYQWGVVLHGGELGYMVESVALHGDARLHRRECWVTW